MKKKNIFIKFLACGLCMTMLAGCSKTEKVSKDDTNNKESDKKQESSITTSTNASEVVMQLKAKYADATNVEYTEPMYNLEKDHVFKFENLSDKFFENEDDDSFAVYYDSNFEDRADIKIEYDYDNYSITISPGLVYSYSDPESSVASDGTWGSRSKFWLVRQIDTETGEKLDKPVVTVFTIARDLNTPTLEQSVNENGSYTLSWSEVEGADYYEVYECYSGTYFSSLEVTTTNTSCVYEEFTSAIEHEKRFDEIYGGTEIDVDAQWQMNTVLDMDDGYFVVAKSNDEKSSGMSNFCWIKDIGNQIPYIVSDDFKDEYEGDNVLALPAYVDVTMVDGSVGQFLISYHGAQATLLDDGRIFIEPSIKNLPIEMQIITFTGMDFETFMAESSKLSEREDELSTKSVTTNKDINVPYVPNNDYDTKDDSTTTPEGETNEPEEDETTTGGSEDETKKSSENDLNISEEVAETVYGNSALSEWIALNMLAHNEEISLAEFPESSDTEHLEDAIMEAYTQNPLCGIMSRLDYDYASNSLLVGYVLSEEETKEMQEASLKKASQIAGEIITDGMSDYEKEDAINQYLCENAEYNDKILDYINSDGTISEDAVLDYANSFTPYGILVENVGVCESYAEAFLMIAREADLEAVIETGRMDGVNHEWNRVNVEGQWYTLDVTNNDCEYLPNCYFNLSDEVAVCILQEDGDAFIDKFISNYSASDMKNEYYTKNDLYTEDAAQAATMLIEILSDNDMAVIRMDEDYGNSDVEKIVKEVINGAKLTSGKYYYNAGVISIVKSA